MNSSPILQVAKDLQQSEWGLVCDTIYSSFSRVIKENKRDINKYVDDILEVTITNCKNTIAEKNTTLKLDYLNALSKVTTLITQLMDNNSKFTHAQELVILMMRLLKEELVDTISSHFRLKTISIRSDLRFSSLQSFSVSNVVVENPSRIEHVLETKQW